MAPSTNLTAKKSTAAAPTPTTYTEELLSFFRTCKTGATEVCAPYQNAKKELLEVLHTSPTKTYTQPADIWQAFVRSLYKPALPKPLPAPDKVFGVQSPLQQAAATSKFTFNSAEWGMYEMGCKAGYKWFLSGEARLLPLLTSLKANPLTVTITQTPFWLGSAFIGASLVLCFVSTARSRLRVLVFLISFTAVLLVANIACYSFVLGPTSCSYSLLGPSKMVNPAEALLRGLLPKYYTLPAQEMPSIRNPAFSAIWNNYECNPPHAKLTQKSNAAKPLTQVALLPGVPKTKIWSHTRQHFAPPFSTSLAMAHPSLPNFIDFLVKVKPPTSKIVLSKAYPTSKIIRPFYPAPWWADDIKHPKWSVFDKRWTLFDNRIKSYTSAYLEKALKVSETVGNPLQLKTMIIAHLEAQNPNVTAAIGAPSRYLPEITLLYSKGHPFVRSIVQSLQWAVDTNNPRVRMVGDVLLPTRPVEKTTDGISPRIKQFFNTDHAPVINSNPLFRAPVENLKTQLHAFFGILRPNSIYSRWIDTLATKSQLWHCWSMGDASRTAGQQYLISYNRILMDFEVNPKKNRLAFWRRYSISYEWFKGAEGTERKLELAAELKQLNPLPQVLIHKMGNTAANPDLVARHRLAQTLSGGIWLVAPANIVITCSSLIGSLLVIILNSTHLYSASSPSWRTYFVSTATRVQAKAKKAYTDWYNFKRLYYVYGGIGYLEYTAKEKLQTEQNVQPLFQPTNMLTFGWWRKVIKKLRFTEVPVAGGFILVFFNLNLLPSGEPAYVVGSMLALAMAHVFYQKIPQQLRAYRLSAIFLQQRPSKAEVGKIRTRYSWLVGDYERTAHQTVTLYVKISEQTAIVRKYAWAILPSAICIVYMAGHLLTTDVEQQRFKAILTCGYAVFCAVLGLPLYFAFVRYETIEFFTKNAVTRLLWAYRQTFLFCYLLATFTYMGVATNCFEGGFNVSVGIALTAIVSLIAYYQVPPNPKKHYIHRILLSVFFVSYLWVNLSVFGFFLFHEAAFGFTAGCVCVTVVVCSQIPAKLYKERTLNPDYALVSRWNKGMLAVLMSSGAFWTWELDLARGVNSGSWLRESYVIAFLFGFIFFYAALSWFSNPISVWRAFAICAFTSILLLWALARCESFDISTTLVPPQATAAWVLCIWAWSFVRLWRYFVVTGSISSYISYIAILLPSVLAVQNNLWVNYVGVNSPSFWAAVILIEIVALLAGVSLIPNKLHRFSVLSYVGYIGLRTQSCKQLFFVFSTGLQLITSGLLVYAGEYQVYLGALFSLFSMLTVFVGMLLWGALSALTLSDKILDLKGALTSSRFLRKYAYTYGLILLLYCLSVLGLLICVF